MEIAADKTAHTLPTVKPTTKITPPQDTPKPIVYTVAAINLLAFNASPVFIYKDVYLYTPIAPKLPPINKYRQVIIDSIRAFI